MVLAFLVALCIGWDQIAGGISRTKQAKQTRM